MLRATLAAIALVPLGAASASAAAKAPLRFVDRASGPAVTDGARYAAYVDDQSTDTVVIDTKARTKRRYETPRDSCGGAMRYLVQIADGRVTWTGCSEVASLDLATGAETGASKVGGEMLGESDYVTGVGSEWVQLGFSGYHFSGVGYVNRRSGATIDTFWGPGLADLYPDLDEAALYTPLCVPLRRRATVNDDPYESLPHWLPYQYRPPYGLSSDRRPLIGRLLLDRCGSTKSVAVGRCSPDCGSVQLGRRAVVWTRGRSVAAYLISKRRSRSREVLRRPVNPSVRAAVTDSTVFVSTSAGGAAWRISSMSLRDFLARHR